MNKQRGLIRVQIGRQLFARNGIAQCLFDLHLGKPAGRPDATPEKRRFVRGLTSRKHNAIEVPHPRVTQRPGKSRFQFDLESAQWIGIVCRQGNGERIERQGKALKNSLEYGVFISEMAVNRSARHSRGIGNFIESGLRNTMTKEYSFCCIENRCTCAQRLRLRPLHPFQSMSVATECLDTPTAQ